MSLPSLTTAPPTTTPEPRVDKSGDKVKAMFGQIARRYDLLNHLLSGGIDITWRNFTVRTVPIRGTAPVLDVCTGTGDLALAYWASARGTVEVLGTDFTPEMLTLAREKFARRKDQFGGGAHPVEFIEADTQQLPFESDRFQIVSVAFGLRNVSDTQAGLKEMIRVCQPGGRVAILEFSQPLNSVLGAMYRWYFNTVLPRVGQWVAKNRHEAYRYLPASVSEFPCGKALAAIMEQSGLQNISFTPLTFGIATLYVGEKPAG